MDYNKIEEQSKLQETVNLHEARYCEQIMEMMNLLGESESVEFIKSLPSHLQEATLKKQAGQMYSRIEQVLENTHKLKRKLEKVNITDKNSKKYLSTRDKNTILEKIRHIEELAEKTKAILDNSEFKKWCNTVDSNTNIFGGKKIGAKGPSRKELGV